MVQQKFIRKAVHMNEFCTCIYNYTKVDTLNTDNSVQITNKLNTLFSYKLINKMA